MSQLKQSETTTELIFRDLLLGSRSTDTTKQAFLVKTDRLKKNAFLLLVILQTHIFILSFQAESQMVVSGVNVSRSFIGSLISTVVLLFVGPWSDCSGRRKPLLILPLVGMSVMTTGVLLMLLFPGASTVQVLYAVQLPMSLGGNFGLLLAAAFSHIGDVSI